MANVVLESLLKPLEEFYKPSFVEEIAINHAGEVWMRLHGARVPWVSYKSENLQYRDLNLPSDFSTKEGFAWYSPSDPPFYAVFPQGKHGYDAISQNPKKLQKLFSLLSNSDTLDAVIYIHRHTGRFVFEAEILAKECGIGEERLDQVMEALLQLGIVRCDRLEIDGKERTLYYAIPSHKWIALLSIACSVDEQGPKMLTGNARKAPYLKPIE